MSNTKREQAVETIGEERVKALEDAFEQWLTVWISKADKTLETVFHSTASPLIWSLDQSRSICRMP